MELTNVAELSNVAPETMMGSEPSLASACQSRLGVVASSKAVGAFGVSLAASAIMMKPHSQSPARNLPHHPSHHSRHGQGHGHGSGSA